MYFSWQSTCQLYMKSVLLALVIQQVQQYTPVIPVLAPRKQRLGGMIKSRSHLVTNQVEDQPKLQETVSNKFFQNNGHLKTFMNFKLKHYLYMGMNSFTVHHGTHVKTRSHSARLSSFLPGLKLRLSDVAEIALRTEQSLQAKNIILSICVKTLRRSQVTLITELYTKAAQENGTLSAHVTKS